MRKSSPPSIPMTDAPPTADPALAGAALPKRRSRVSPAALVVHAIVLVVYLCFATQASWKFAGDDPEKFSYPMLADAFLRGHTYLPVDPAPELLALPNPYDTEAHAKLALVD